MSWSISPAAGIRRLTPRRFGLGSGCPSSVPPGDGYGWLRCRKLECEAVLQRITREQRTPYTVTDVALLMEKIAQVRRQGYATIEQEFEIGMLVLAVPLTDREGTWWGALSLTSHQSRTSLEALCHDHLDLLYSAQAMLVS